MKYVVVHFTITRVDQPQQKDAEMQDNVDDQQLEIAADLLCAIVADAGFEAFENIDEGVKGYAQEDLFDNEMLDQLLEQWPMNDYTISYTVEEAEDKDWNETWEQSGFPPVNINDKFVVYDAKRPIPEVEAGKMAIGIDARQAFGTGNHETTQLMIAALANTDVCGRRVLDCGCGTGILSIAASMLGASDIVAYDIDEWSVQNTQHNATLNSCTNIDVFLGDSRVLSHVSGTFDVVMANINRNQLLADMPVFAEVMSKGGQLLLSGFYEEDTPQLTDMASSLGLYFIEKSFNDKWCCLRFQKY